MIERTFTINGALIEVAFHWDPGDESVGIGWGEETGALIKAGPVWTFVGFEPDDKDVEDWRVKEVQINYVVKGENEIFVPLALTEYGSDVGRYDSGEGLTLGRLPDICEAVKITWTLVQASLAPGIADLEQEANEYAEAGRRVPQALVDGLAQASARLAQTRAEYERCKAEYEATYGAS